MRINVSNNFIKNWSTSTDNLLVTNLAASLLLLLPALLFGQPDRFALPGCTGPEQELADRTFFVLCHDSLRKVPVWTGYEMTRERLRGAAVRPGRFRPDTALSGPIAIDADYRGSGFSRGHLVPAEDLAWSEASIRSTFLLSNAVPQRQSVNAGKWRQLENFVRSIAAGADLVYVFSGPIFADRETEYIGGGRVAVPTHLYKVVLALADGRKSMYAAIVPNAATGDEPLGSFTTTVREVERRTGLDFFSALEDEEERRLESDEAGPGPL
jgi:endonuclease G, mitochondrial